MRHAVVGVFEQHAQAVEAAQALQRNGLGPAQVQVTDAMASADAEEADDTVAAHIRSFFAEVFGPTPEHHARHAEHLRGGGALVRVDLDDDQSIEGARRTLLASGAVRIEEHGEPPPSPQ